MDIFVFQRRKGVLNSFTSSLKSNDDKKRVVKFKK